MYNSDNEMKAQDVEESRKNTDAGKTQTRREYRGMVAADTDRSQGR